MHQQCLCLCVQMQTHKCESLTSDHLQLGKRDWPSTCLCVMYFLKIMHCDVQVHGHLHSAQEQVHVYLPCYYHSIDATPMHCSTGHGKIASLLSSAPLQKELTACLCHCIHTYADLLFIQVCSAATLMHCSTDKGTMPCPLLSAALQNGLTACLCHCNCTYGNLLFIHVCVSTAN